MIDDDREHTHELDRDHKSICKISGADDPAWKVVGSAIKEMVEKAGNHQVHCKHCQAASASDKEAGENEHSPFPIHPPPSYTMSSEHQGTT